VTSGQLRDFYSQWLGPNRATLIAVGPVNARDLSAVLERHFGVWEPSSNPSAQPLVPAAEFSRSRAGLRSRIGLRSRVALIDRSDLAQTGIFAAMRLPPRRDPDIDALTVANAALGGMFSSRLNLVLRETHGWSYGAHSRMHHARFGGLWIVHAFVRPDRAADAMREMHRQLHGLARQQSIGEAEFVRVRDHLVASLPAAYETNAQLAEALRDLVLHDLPDNYYAETAGHLARLRLRDLSRACRRRLGAAHISWLVIGDAARISPQVASAGFGAPEIIDAAR
jgi:zinc protease